VLTDGRAEVFRKSLPATTEDEPAVVNHQLSVVFAHSFDDFECVH
jgi:hypothetical protein